MSASPAIERPGLHRKLDRFGLFSLAFGSMIGVGWVTALGSWLDLAGPVGAAAAFLVGGLVIAAIGLCYAEVTPMLPVAGGEVAYAYKAFDTSKAFLVGWFLAFGYISVSAFEAISVGKVISYLLPGIDRWLLYRVDGDPVYLTHLLLGVLCTALITFVHYRGVAWAGALQKWLTGMLILATLVFIVAGFAVGRVEHLEPAVPAGGWGAVTAGVIAVLVTVPFWFVGFDTIPQGAEEAEASVAPKQLGTLILASIVVAVLFYVAIIMSAALTGPWQSIVASELPTARAFELAFPSQWLARLVLIAALLGLFTSWNGFFLAGSRVVFALGRGRIISGAFGTTHPRHGSPFGAVLLVGAVTVLAPALGRNALLAFVNVGSFCIAVAFLGVALSMRRLRHAYPDARRPYRAPGGAFLPAAAAIGSLFILGVMLVPGSPAALVWPLEILILSCFALLGLVFWHRGATIRRSVTEAQRAHLILEDFAEDVSLAERGERASLPSTGE